MNEDTSIPPMPEGLRSGRTQWMIERLCDAVTFGQPKSRVFGWNTRYALEVLKPRIVKELESRGFIAQQVSKDTLIVDDSIIKLCSMQTPREAYIGTQGWGEFYDHYEGPE